MPQPSVLITGCSSGIGRALADAFMAGGYAVWATARKEGDLAALQQAGLISYSRGHITVTDRKKMEARSCECYETVKDEYRRLLPQPASTPSPARKP